MTTTNETKPCANEACRRDFVPVRPHQRFCSDECRASHHRQQTNPLEHETEFSLSLANPNPSFKTRKDGDHYFVEFELQREEWDHFTDPNVNRQGLLIEAQCMVAHSNKPNVVYYVNKADPEQWRQENLKGGPLARLAGMLCNDPKFWEWINDQADFIAVVRSADDARGFIVECCEITSRKDLDSNPARARIFHEQIRLPYSNWLDKQRRPA